MITAIVSTKGGVGKTTTTICLAAALAEAGRRVLVIDLDANASASMSLGMLPGAAPFSVSDVLLDGQPAQDAIFPTSTPDLSIMPASVDLRRADLDLERLRRGDIILRRLLEPLRDDFDHIFLDCPPILGAVMRNALVAADGFLIPTPPHFLAIESIEPLIASAERVAWRAGHPAHFLGVVLTMVDYRIQSTRSMVRKIRQRFGTKVFAIEIRTNVSLAEAPALGKTIYQYRPRATGARAYQLLATELIDASTSVSSNRAAI